MRRLSLFALTLAGAAVLGACSDPTGPVAAVDEAAFAAAPNACWGQASKVFARLGKMGEHASAEPTPRIGLANLAKALYDAGVIPEPTMAALGAFVADAEGLSIDACL